jgi:hypothetical protein
MQTVLQAWSVLPAADYVLYWIIWKLIKVHVNSKGMAWHTLLVVEYCMTALTGLDLSHALFSSPSLIALGSTTYSSYQELQSPDSMQP